MSVAELDLSTALLRRIRTHPISVSANIIPLDLPAVLSVSTNDGSIMLARMRKHRKLRLHRIKLVENDRRIFLLTREHHFRNRWTDLSQSYGSIGK